MLPLLHQVTHRHPVNIGEDAYGNPLPAWTSVVRDVYGWWVPDSSEPGAVVDGQLVADVILDAPTFPVGAQDEFDIPGFPRPLRVEGLPRVWDYGPSGWKPGMHVYLKLVAQ